MEAQSQLTRRSFFKGASIAAISFALCDGGPLIDVGYALGIAYPDYKPQDTYFSTAYIDIDEWRSFPQRYRYVHGGFKNTATRFSFYFPEEVIYGGRFIHTFEGGPGGNENTTPVRTPDNYTTFSSTNLELAFAEGAYLVESNQGHIGYDFSGANYDPSIVCWRASAESARFSKYLAGKMYGETPHHGYALGGSGGGNRSLKSLEEVNDVWDGGVPFVMPHDSNVSFFAMMLDAQRLLGPALMNTVYDAVDVGGHGDPYRGLNPEQAEALRILYRSGFPRGVALNEGTAGLAGMVWAWQKWNFDRYDPTYFNDFWMLPGYLGHDDPTRFAKDRLRVEARVKRVLTGREFMNYKPPFEVDDRFGAGNYNRGQAVNRTSDTPAAVILENVSANDLGKMGWSPLEFTTGAGKGRSMAVVSVVGDAVSVTGIGGKLLEGVQPGDSVVIDNSAFLAFCYHWRFQIEPDYAEWRHSVKDGKAIYPQRPILEKLYGARYTHKLGNKKIIVVQGMADRGTWPSAAVAYRDKLSQASHGKIDDQFRLWFQEHHDHGGGEIDESKLVPYSGYVQQAVHEVIAWVEQGKPPRRSSQFTYTDNCEVQLAPQPKARGGIQPLVSVLANGKSGRLSIKAGTRVEFDVSTEMPSDLGMITKVEWSFDGAAQYPFAFTDITGDKARVERRTAHVYDKPGTYFAVCRVTAHPAGDKNARLYLMPNLGRIRIVVD